MGLTSQKTEEENESEDSIEISEDEINPDTLNSLRQKKSQSVAIHKGFPQKNPKTFLRSNSHFVNYCKKEYVPKQKPKQTDVLITPMKLCKNKVICKHSNQEIIKDYLLENIDCNSCNDEAENSLESSDIYSSNSSDDDTQSNTPVDNSLTEVRKEMQKLRNSHIITERMSNEYENILTIDSIINQKDELNQMKRRSFFKRHISLLCDKNNNNDNINNNNSTNIQNDPFAFVKGTSEPSIFKFRNTLKNKSSQLSLLGILESAAKEANTLRYSKK